MPRPIYLISTVILVGLLAACQGAAQIATRTPVPPTAMPAAPTNMATSATGMGGMGRQADQQQVAAGQQIYATDCAECHGSNLQGATAPELSRNILSSYGDAGHLVEYITDQMPQNAPGSLDTQQYYAVTAFILQHAGLLPAGEALTPQDAPQIALAQAIATAPPQTAIGAEGAQQQVAAGQRVYGAACAGCHGANLQGVTAPALTQSTLARYTDARRLVEYVSDQMPQGAPGSLSSRQYYEVTAFILQQAGLLPAGEALTPQDAPQIALAQATATALPQEAIGAEGAQQQVAAGQQVYATDCASCHGANLQGVTAPALTRSTLSIHANAKQLVEYISDQMPQGAPGSLTKKQYYEVTAFILQQAGLLPARETLTTQDAANIVFQQPTRTPTPLPVGQTAVPTATPLPTPTPTPQSLIVVKVAEIPTVGRILTNSQGFTLYHNVNDKPGVSTCTGLCADTWPPLTVPKDTRPIAAPGIPGALGVFQRSDGTYQVTYTDLPTYNAVPLYTYSADTEAGDRTGQSLYDIWFAVNLPPSATPTPTATPVVGQGDAALGAVTYLENCTPCHGIQGQGVDAPPLRNSRYVQTAGGQALFGVIANGRSGTEMPAWLQTNGGPLTGAQIDNVVTYLRTLQGVPPLPTATPAPEEPTATPLPPGAPTPAPARPSEPGGPGAAASLAGDIARGRSAFGPYCASCHGPEGVQGIPNPGSDDGSVPPLNPIDPTIANPDPKVFAVNVDLFIQHGSVPEGPGPLLLMPPFGERNMLTQQQIADLIAYVMSLNGVTASSTP